jgi:hypothetical protein
MRHPDTLRTKSRTHTVARTAHGYTVTSGHTGAIYEVQEIRAHVYTCSCDWSAYRPAQNRGACACSHVLSVIAFDQAERERSTQVFNSYESARRQHRQILDIGDGILVTTRKAA